MANTLTGLIPRIYEALNIVSREMVGFIPAVARDASAERAAVDQTIRVPVAGTSSLADNTPAVTAPDTGDTTDEYVDITISKSKHYPIRFSGEETLSLSGNGNYDDLVRQKFAEGFRALVNAVETDLADSYQEASRAFGTAGTAPFGTKDDFTDFAGVAQILDDNGAPVSDRQLVAGSAAWYNLRGVQTGLLQKANEAGTPAALRQGIFGDVHGFALRNTGQAASHTKGTATGFDANGGEPVGETEIVVDGSDSGTILAGDVVTWAGDSNKYVIASATASGSASGNITLNDPGLEEALADTVEGTIGDSFTANLAFHRNAIQLLTRLPATPEGGDAADDRMMVTDPFSGLTFEVAMYRQYRQLHMEVALAWGYKVIKPAHVALLLG